MARNDRVTIREIARMCRVSTQTVSRVINKRPDVAPETRAAVEAAIAAVGFQPSAVARSLVQRRSRTLGVIISGLRFFGVSQTLNGITEASEAAGYGLLLQELGSLDTPDIVPVLEFLISHRVDGMIFASPQYRDNVQHVQAQLPAASPPIVFLKSRPSPRFPTIGIDNEGGARLATRHLLALGRRRIAHLSGPLEWLEARDRRDGWRDALAEAGLAATTTTSGNWSSASGEAALPALLARDPDIDGIFVANDQMALGVLRAAHLRGVRVPDDIAVVGFDGLAEAAQFIPSLTTVRQPLRELGSLAVRELLEQVDRDGSDAGIARATTLATELIVRESAPDADASAPSDPPPSQAEPAAG